MRYRLSTLMIALAIVLPLLGVVFYSRPSDCRPENAASATISMLSDAVNYYSLQVEQLPLDLDALLVPPSDLENPTKWKGPYLKNPPSLDPWDGPFRYEILDAAHGRFRIWSDGRDGKSGTADDVSVESDDLGDWE